MNDVMTVSYRLQAVCNGMVKTILDQTGTDYLIVELTEAVRAALDWQAMCGKPVRLYAFGSNGRAASLIVNPDQATTEQANRLSMDLRAPRKAIR